MRKAWWRVWLSVSIGAAVSCGVDEGKTRRTFVPVCDDSTPLQNSCLAELFSCFDPSGSCAVKSQASEGTFDFRAIVWTSGAEYRVGHDAVTGDLVIRVDNSNGATCAQGAGTQVEGEFRKVTFTIAGGTHGTDELRMESDRVGNLLVTCPNGMQEAYTDTEADAILNCMGFRCSGDEI